jgi:hypothetical protein
VELEAPVSEAPVSRHALCWIAGSAVATDARIDFAVGEQQEAIDDVGQLANVAGPE